MGCSGEYLNLKRRKRREAGEDCIMRASQHVRFTKYCSGGQMKEDEMGGKCSTHVRDEKFMELLENLRGRDYSEDLGVDGKIILEWTLRK
jgi:hypothetical protein